MGEPWSANWKPKIISHSCQAQISAALNDKWYLLTRFKLVMVEISKAITANKNAFPPIIDIKWNPIGIVINPKTAIPKIIAGNTWKRCLARPSPISLGIFIKSNRILCVARTCMVLFRMLLIHIVRLMLLFPYFSVSTL